MNPLYNISIWIHREKEIQIQSRKKNISFYIAQDYTYCELTQKWENWKSLLILHTNFLIYIFVNVSVRYSKHIENYSKVYLLLLLLSIFCICSEHFSILFYRLVISISFLFVCTICSVCLLLLVSMFFFFASSFWIYIIKKEKNVCNSFISHYSIEKDILTKYNRFSDQKWK